MKKIRFIVATRESASNFHQKTLTGQSLNIFKVPFLELKLYPDNSEGLSHIYNKEIALAANDPAILVFAHDDLLFLGYYWVNDIFNAMQAFDVVGITGNKRRLPHQSSWVFKDPDRQLRISKIYRASSVMDRLTRRSNSIFMVNLVKRSSCWTACC